jgi:hypothetical protein
MTDLLTDLLTSAEAEAHYHDCGHAYNNAKIRLALAVAREGGGSSWLGVPALKASLKTRYPLERWTLKDLQKVERLS